MYEKKTMKNGLTVVTSSMPQMASVSMGIWLGVGGRYEKKEQSGISHLIEHMLFKGTNARSAQELKGEIEGIGGAFNGFTSDEVTCYMVKVPAKYVKLGVDILSDMVLNSKFNKEEIAREKFVVCEEIKMYKDQPADHVLDMLSEIMWSGNALGRPLTGNMATVKKMTRKQLCGYKNKYYHPGNIAVIASGKVNPEKFCDYVTEKFSGEKKKRNFSFESPSLIQEKSRVKILTGNTQQAHIAMGFYANGRDLRERFAMKLMNVILGGNMSSRLFEQLREKNGLCYDIASSYKRHSDLGELHIHAGVDNRKAVKSILSILDELKRLKDKGVSQAELVHAKEYIKGQFLLAMENTSSRMLWLGDRIIVHKKITELKDILKNIDNVSIEDIDKVSGYIFKPEAVNLAMIGKITDKDKGRIKRGIKTL